MRSPLSSHSKNKKPSSVWSPRQNLIWILLAALFFCAVIVPAILAFVGTGAAQYSKFDVNRQMHLDTVKQDAKNMQKEVGMKGPQNDDQILKAEVGKDAQNKPKVQGDLLNDVHAKSKADSEKTNRNEAKLNQNVQVNHDERDVRNEGKVNSKADDEEVADVENKTTYTQKLKTQDQKEAVFQNDTKVEESSKFKRAETSQNQEDVKRSQKLSDANLKDISENADRKAKHDDSKIIRNEISNAPKKSGVNETKNIKRKNKDSDWEKRMINLWMDTESSELCADIIGNSFRARTDICSSGRSSSGSCYADPYLASSNCQLFNVKLDASKISVANGGEDIEDVWGQSEEAEFPKFGPGSIEVDCEKSGHSGALPHYLGDFIGAMSDISDLQCSRWENKTTFAITRYDYANMYHTSCGFYNFFQAVQIVGHRHDDINVLFLDGHPKGSLDEPWSVAFGEVHRISSFKDEAVCFRELILVNPEYRIQIFPGSHPGTSACKSSPFFEDFARFFKSKHGIVESSRPEKPTICYIFRKDYIAHPRQGNRAASRKIANEEELLAAARKLPEAGKVIPLYFEKMPFAEQLRQISECDIVAGMHGAGLTHALFMREGSGMLELAPFSYSQLRFFDIVAHVKGIKYFSQMSGISGPDHLFTVDVQANMDALRLLLRKMSY